MNWKDGSRFSPESVELELSCGFVDDDVVVVRLAGSGEACGC